MLLLSLLLGCEEKQTTQVVEESSDQAIDWDCDGILTEDDCNDADAESTTVATDADCDGTVSEDDCDDTDPESFTILTDADCDGYPTEDDCDDFDANMPNDLDDLDCNDILDREKISLGTAHSCVIDASKSIQCWGYNSEERLDAPSGSFSQISVGDAHSCAFDSSKDHTAGGMMILGNPVYSMGSWSRFRQEASILVPSRRGGVLQCWGTNEDDQLNLPTGSSYRFRQEGHIPVRLIHSIPFSVGGEIFLVKRPLLQVLFPKFLRVVSIHVRLRVQVQSNAGEQMHLVSLIHRKGLFYKFLWEQSILVGSMIPKPYSAGVRISMVSRVLRRGYLFKYLRERITAVRLILMGLFIAGGMMSSGNLLCPQGSLYIS